MSGSSESHTAQSKPLSGPPCGARPRGAGRLRSRPRRARAGAAGGAAGEPRCHGATAHRHEAVQRRGQPVGLALGWLRHSSCASFWTSSSDSIFRVRGGGGAAMGLRGGARRACGAGVGGCACAGAAAAAPPCSPPTHPQRSTAWRHAGALAAGGAAPAASLCQRRLPCPEMCGREGCNLQRRQPLPTSGSSSSSQNTQ